LITDALESIFDQSCPPIEEIVVVDSTAEMSSAWTRRIENDFPKTSIHRQESVGMASALASGIRQTSSNYIAFLDGDDLWTRGKQAVQIDVLEAVPGPIEYTDTLQVRNRVFKVIRAKVCKNWLEYVRLLIVAAMAEMNLWCDDDVANAVLQQLEAWFATVPHKDVRWSNYLNERDKYRVCWWKD
jgi:glycosyltransferase involved in cell wall biosynthesis